MKQQTKDDILKKLEQLEKFDEKSIKSSIDQILFFDQDISDYRIVCDKSNNPPHENSFYKHVNIYKT